MIDGHALQLEDVASASIALETLARMDERSYGKFAESINVSISAVRAESQAANGQF